MKVDATGKPVEEGAAAASGGGDGKKTVAIPKSLERFVDSTSGTLDMEKVAENLLESERKVTKAGEEKATIQAAYEALVAQGGDKVKAAPVNATGRKKVTVDDLTIDPDAVIRGTVNEEVEGDRRAVSSMLLAMAHPEMAEVIDEGTGETRFADPEFAAGLKRYIGTLPRTTQAALKAMDYQTMDHTIKTFKALRAKIAAQKDETLEEAEERLPSRRRTGEVKTNFAESGRGATKKTGGKIWRTAEIREMIARHPEEYAKNEAEITKAYEEDRVE